MAVMVFRGGRGRGVVGTEVMGLVGAVENVKGGVFGVVSGG